MAINENPSLPNRHIFVAAMTGGGKSNLLRQEINGLLRAGVSKRVVFWDPDRDHKCKHYKDKKAFLLAMKALMSGSKGGAIGWCGDDSGETFEWFMSVLWAALDGKKPIIVGIEEAADLCLPQQVKGYAGKMQRRSRKYGGILASGTQRIQEVPKSFITSSKTVFVGMQQANDLRYVKNNLGLNTDDVEALEELQFFRKIGKKVDFVEYEYIA